jgi:hypothetical protein
VDALPRERKVSEMSRTIAGRLTEDLPNSARWGESE